MQRDVLFIEEMIDAASRAIEIVRDASLEQLEADRDRRDALLWNFTVLGEAATHVSTALKASHDDIAWEKPSGLRNRIIHGYWSIDLGILHTTASNDLPGFVGQLRSVLERMDQLGADKPG